MYCVGDNVLSLVVTYTDTVDGLSITVTALVVDRFGCITFCALERKRVSCIVDMWAGAITTVRTVMTCPFRAFRVLLQTICS